MSRTGYPIAASLAGNGSPLVNTSPGVNSLLQPWSFWHRRNIDAAGNTNLIFFNEPKGLGITNLDQAGQLAANQEFTILGMTFHFLPGFDRLGNRLGVSAASQAQINASLLNRSFGFTGTADDAAAQVYWNEKARELLEQGTVSLTIASRTWLTQYGLTQFPAGRGVLSEANEAYAVTATGVAVGSVRSGVFNGAPLNNNVERFATPVPLVAGQSFSVTVDWNKAVDFTQQYAGPLYNVSGAVTAGVLTCELFGLLKQPTA